MSPRFWYCSLKNPLLKLSRCYSVHPVSILTFTTHVRLFQAALKSILIDLPTSNTAKHTYNIKSYFQKKVEKSVGNTKIAVKFHVNRKWCNEEKWLTFGEYWVLQEHLWKVSCEIWLIFGEFGCFGKKKQQRIQFVKSKNCVFEWGSE